MHVDLFLFSVFLFHVHTIRQSVACGGRHVTKTYVLSGACSNTGSMKQGVLCARKVGIRALCLRHPGFGSASGKKAPYAERPTLPPAREEGC